MAPPIVPEMIVSDFERSLGFYTHVLGFNVMYARPSERFAYLEREGAQVMIEQPTVPGRLMPAERMEYPYGRGMNLEIAASDSALLYAAVLAASLDPYLALEERWYARTDDEVGVLQFAVRDPDGYLLRFSQELGVRPQ